MFSSPSYLPLARRAANAVRARCSPGQVSRGWGGGLPRCHLLPSFLGLSSPRQTQPASCHCPLRCYNLAPRGKGSHVLHSLPVAGWTRHSQPTEGQGSGRRVCHAGLTRGPGNRKFPSCFQAEPPFQPSISQQPRPEEMCEIRKLLLCFPFGFYPYVQASLGRKPRRKGGEQ